MKNLKTLASSVRSAVASNLAACARFYGRAIDELSDIASSSRARRDTKRSRSASPSCWARVRDGARTLGMVLRIGGAILVDLLKPSRPEHRLPRRWSTSEAR